MLWLWWLFRRTEGMLGCLWFLLALLAVIFLSLFIYTVGKGIIW
jgi:hypothetical protein